MTNTKHSRRQFLRKMGLLSAGAALSSPAVAATVTSSASPSLASPVALASIHKSLAIDSDMTLAFNNLHTGESLKTTFFAEGQFIDEGIQAISYLLRDHRNNQVGLMNPELMVMLHDLQQTLGATKPFEVISGYRSAETNAMLSQRSNKVAKKSLHMQGKAIDIRIPGIQLTNVHTAARQMNQGGVGLYTRSNFVHLDTGRPRFWGS